MTSEYVDLSNPDTSHSTMFEFNISHINTSQQRSYDKD